MSKTKGEMDPAAMIAGERLVGGIAIHLQNAGKIRQLSGDLLRATAGREHVGNRRRRGPAPWSVIHGMRPELADAGAMSSGVEHWHRRLVAEHARRALDRPQLKLIEAFEPPGGTLHPAGERRAVELDALAGQDLHLPVQRQIPGELRDHHVGHEGRRRHAALNEARQHLRLHHAVGAAAAAVLGTDCPQHAQNRRDHVQHLADVLADLVKPTLAARARGRLRLQHLLTARQMLGQRADVAARLLPRRPAKRLRRCRIVVGSGR